MKNISSEEGKREREREKENLMIAFAYKCVRYCVSVFISENRLRFKEPEKEFRLNVI